MAVPLIDPVDPNDCWQWLISSSSTQLLLSPQPPQPPPGVEALPISAPLTRPKVLVLRHRLKKGPGTEYLITLKCNEK